MGKIDEIYTALKGVVDPEVGFDVVALGLIYDVAVEGAKAKIKMTLSTRSCPLHEMMLGWVKNAAESVEGVSECEIELVWEPAWNISMASEEVRAALS